MLSFAKIKPSQNFLNLQYIPAGQLVQLVVDPKLYVPGSQAISAVDVQ